MSMLSRLASRKGWRNDYCGGLRLSLPLWGRAMRRYDIVRDEFWDGLWLLQISVAVDRLGSGPRTHGASIRLTWGWVAHRGVSGG